MTVFETATHHRTSHPYSTHKSKHRPTLNTVTLCPLMQETEMVKPQANKHIGEKKDKRNKKKNLTFKFTVGSN